LDEDMSFQLPCAWRPTATLGQRRYARRGSPFLYAAMRRSERALKGGM